MTHTIDGLYGRYSTLLNEIDMKDDNLRPWQVNELHRLAEEAEKVLAGCRRKQERRSA